MAIHNVWYSLPLVLFYTAVTGLGGYLVGVLIAVRQGKDED